MSTDLTALAASLVMVATFAGLNMLANTTRWLKVLTLCGLLAFLCVASLIAARLVWAVAA